MLLQRLYNLNQISFLIGSFNNTIHTFGQNSKSVAFFRQQVNSLINIGQVKESSAEFVYKLIGMENTDSVKWNISDEKVSEFINCMNVLFPLSQSGELNSDVIINQYLFSLKAQGIMTDKTEKYIRDLYGVHLKDSIKINTNTHTFGVIDTTNPKGNKAKVEEATSQVATRPMARDYDSFRQSIFKNGKIDHIIINDMSALTSALNLPTIDSWHNVQYTAKDVQTTDDEKTFAFVEVVTALEIISERYKESVVVRVKNPCVCTNDKPYDDYYVDRALSSKQTLTNLLGRLCKGSQYIVVLKRKSLGMYSMDISDAVALIRFSEVLNKMNLRDAHKFLTVTLNDKRVQEEFVFNNAMSSPIFTLDALDTIGKIVNTYSN